jgi:hypothetical protein
MPAVMQMRYLPPRNGGFRIQQQYAYCYGIPTRERTSPGTVRIMISVCIVYIIIIIIISSSTYA